MRRPVSIEIFRYSRLPKKSTLHRCPEFLGPSGFLFVKLIPLRLDIGFLNILNSQYPFVFVAVYCHTVAGSRFSCLAHCINEIIPPDAAGVKDAAVRKLEPINLYHADLRLLTSRLAHPRHWVDLPLRKASLRMFATFPHSQRHLVRPLLSIVGAAPITTHRPNLLLTGIFIEPLCI